MPTAITPRPLGPFVGGVVDQTNRSLQTRGTLKRARSLVMLGTGKLAARGGSALAMTFKDDAGSPANVTAVCAIVPFSDGALVVAHSTNTNKAYLYRTNSTLTGWYNAAGVLQNNTNAQPIGALWTSITTAPDVLIAEGLGEAYIAHTEGADSSALVFATKKYTQPGTIATFTADLDGSGGAEDIYALGVESFQNHLWFWGFGSGTIAANGYRPELARYGGPNFTAPIGADSITVGNRVRSQREKIIAGKAVGSALFLAGPFLLVRVTGNGRSSWFKKPLGNDPFGVVGPKAMCAAGDYLWAWGPRGPYRCHEAGLPEPKWEPIAAAIAGVVNTSRIVASFDEGRDLVRFYYDAGNGVRTYCAYHTVRNVWLGPDDDTGLAIRAAATVSPVYASTAAPTIGPAGAPSSASTTAVTTSSATANWTAGDSVATTRVEYRRQSDTAWTIAVASLAAGVASYVITGLTSNVAYEWRAVHLKDGIESSYLGPAAATQFTTASTTLTAPSSLALSSANVPGYVDITAAWTNGEVEPGTKTEVHFSGPSVGAPAAGTYVQAETIDVPGASSTSGPPAAIRVNTTGRYWVKVRHTRDGYTESSFTSAVSIDVTVTGDPE